MASHNIHGYEYTDDGGILRTIYVDEERAAAAGLVLASGSNPGREPHMVLRHVDGKNDVSGRTARLVIGSIVDTLYVSGGTFTLTPQGVSTVYTITGRIGEKKRLP